MAQLNDISDARVDVDDIRGGAFHTKLTDADIKQHISTAHMVVEDDLAGEGMSGERLARIELFLTRHFIRAGPNRQVESDSTGPVGKTYSGSYNHKFFESTAPGQQALMLDSSNSLGKSGSFDEFFALG